MQAHFYDFNSLGKKAEKTGERLAWVVSAIIAAVKLLIALGIIG